MTTDFTKIAFSHYECLMGFVLNRKSGNIQSQGYCCLQISASAAQFRTNQGEAPVAQIITSESIMLFICCSQASHHKKASKKPVL